MSNFGNFTTDPNLAGVVHYFPSAYVRNLITRNVKKSLSSYINEAKPTNVLYSPLGKEVADALNQLKSNDVPIIINGLATLSNISHSSNLLLSQAVQLVVELLKKHPSPTVRTEAAWTLWKLNDKNAIEALMHALFMDASQNVREVSARALGLMKAQSAIPLLSKMLLDKNTPTQVRMGLALSLGSFRNVGLIPVLSKVIDAPSPLLRKSTIKSLGIIASTVSNSEAIFLRKLFSKFLSPKKEKNADVRAETILAFRSIPDKNTAEKIIYLLEKDPNITVKRNAALFLASVYHPMTPKALIGSLSNEDWLVRKNAGLSLSRYICQFGAQDRCEILEALTRIQRMFPQFSCVWDEAQKAIDCL